ncbi:MAG: ATP-binding protein, partial [Rhodomicrobium sp.]
MLMHSAITSSAASSKSFEPLLRDGDFAVYRRRDATGGAAGSVLAVIPNSDRPERSSFDRLRHEYELKDALEPGWAARPLELVQEDGRSLLLLEDPGGEFLEGLISKPMAAAPFLRLGIGLAKTLAKLHQRGLIHKDIKPVHILVDQKSGAAWLTGFGIATRLPRERQAPEPPEILAGTLAYMAPEQTGRMNRSIDARSDLYSLGVTFYRMLTGDLPFQASDPMEWVHCHIARKPVPPIERAKATPAPLSAIVMKLLAKNAEERYQTAAGLEKDLERCLAEWETQGRISEFALGRHDTPDQLLIPEKLYGRERETETLLAAFDRVVQTGVPELVLVSGYSGIGKSSVVNELHKALVPPRGLFASGKFDQYKRGIPYSTLAQAFERLIRPLLGKSEAELDGWRRALQEALGPNGKLIVDLVPDLKLIVGEQPPVPELEPSQAKARFQLMFRRFIGIFACPEHPLALFLDDLQWLDAATLDLMEDLLTQQDVRHLLLIGAYRDNEVSSVHPFMRKLDSIRKAGAKVQEINLAALNLKDLTQLTADSLHCETERAGPLAQLVYAKTAGNPFFAIQFLSALAQEGLVVFDHGEGRWSWDLNRIHAKRYTDNVADLMAGKLTRLPDNTQNALQRLACLGNTAAAPTLSLVLETPEEEVHAALREAVRQELVHRLEDAYRFTHDRVHEAAYSLIPECSRADAHLRIGRLLLAHTPKQKREEAVFEIAGQLNRGAALIASKAEREELAALNLTAGKRAKA